MANLFDLYKLIKENEVSAYTIYLDMDGVIANFDQRFRDIAGMEPKEFEEKYPGLERVNVSLPMGTPQGVLIEQMQMFSEQVIPQFKNITVTTN